MFDEEPRVDSALAVFMASAGRVATALCNTWSVLGLEFAGHSRDGSLERSDVEVVRRSVHVERLSEALSARLVAAQYSAALAQIVRSQAALWLSGELSLAGYVLARAEWEYAGRIGWLLDPDVDATARFKRAQMERHASLIRSRDGVKGAMHASANEAKRRRNANVQRLRVWFPDDEPPRSGVELQASPVNGRPSFVLGGEPYRSLTATADDLGRLLTVKNARVYGWLSARSHPSVSELAALTEETQLDDYVEHRFQMEGDEIGWLVETVLKVALHSFHVLLAYVGVASERLDQWEAAAARDLPELHWT